MYHWEYICISSSSSSSSSIVVGIVGIEVGVIGVIIWNASSTIV